MPLGIEWEITYSCNSKCLHCHVAGQNTAELSTDESLKIVDQLAKLKIFSVAFTGGEPLLRRDLYEILGYSLNRGLTVTLATNGLLIDRQVALKLKKIGLSSVQISLDSSLPEIHDKIRGEGAHEAAFKAINYCCQAGIPTTIVTVLSKLNFRELGQIMLLAARLGVAEHRMFRFVPLGIGAKNASELSLSLANYRLLLKIWQSWRQKLAHLCNFKIEDPVAHVALKETKAFGGCSAGITGCTLTPDGCVKPCSALPIVAGSLKEKTFKEIWRHSTIFRRLRNRHKFKGKCGMCKLNSVCGGCRASVYSLTGDYTESDTLCLYK